MTCSDQQTQHNVHKYQYDLLLNKAYFYRKATVYFFLHCVIYVHN